MRTAERVAHRFILAREMSREKALEVLGFPPESRPSQTEVMLVYRNLAKKMHPDRGGDLDAMVELNVAKDILTGERAPLESPSDWGVSDTDVAYPGTEGGGFKPEPFKREIITFKDALSKASIPHSKWLFVTQPVSSGYRTDTATKYASGWVAVGERDTTWDFVIVENVEDASYYVGGGYQYVTYTIQTLTIPKRGPADAQTLYKGVLKAWKLFSRLEKRFNSKVIPLPEGWHFSDTWPKANPVSIKNFLLNTGVLEESQLKTPLKYVIEIHIVMDHEEKPGFFKPKYGDWTKLTLIINGRDFDLTADQGEKLSRLRVRGTPFLDRVFGRYYYGGETKNLSKNRDGKLLMAWMADNLTGLPDPVVIALKGASA